MRTLLRARSLAVLALAAGLAACKGSAAPTFPKAPVILISVDTLRADHLPAYGYAKVRTPNLDRLLPEVWLFENAYTPCPMTLPAHTSMLSGQLPPEHGVRNNAGFVFDGQAHANLPRLLKQHGYATGATVSSYVLRYESGLGPLFDYYEDSVETAPGVETVHYRRAGDKTEAFAKDWIAKHANEPFFFFFHIYEPHLPYDPPEPFRSAYGVTYDAMVATADSIVGAFLDDLKRLGVYDRALIIVTGDHGEGLGDHGEEQHSILLYMEAIRVPLMLKLPGSAGAGRRVTAPVQLSDVLPTVTSLVRLDTPKEVSGISLLALAGRGAAERVIYSETLYPWLQLGWSDLRSVVDSHYHYIFGPRPELYDIVADPGEKRDIMAGNGDVAARLDRELRTFPTGEVKPASADQETLRKLAALGYIGGVRERAPSGQLPNPVDNLKYLARMRDGWQLASQRRYPQALAALVSIVHENPAMVEVWVKIGDVLAEMGLDVEAAKAYRQALERSAVFLGDIAVSMGYSELRARRLDEAEGAARRALASNPDKARELLVRVALARDQLDVAEAEAVAAVGERNPQPPAMLLLAEVHIRKGEPARALEDVAAAEARARELHLLPVYRLEFLRADALARANRFAEADAAYRREIASFPADSQAYANLAVLLFVRGDRAGVDRLMEQMAKASPGRRTYLLAAQTYRVLGAAARAQGWQRCADTELAPSLPQ